MGAIGPFQILLPLIYILVIVFPVWKVMQRLGFSGWWSLLAVIPLLNLAALWALAFVKCPRD